MKDWIGCPAMVGAIVPGQLRKLETVFEVVGLQVPGISISGSSIPVSSARKRLRARRGARLHSRTHVHVCSRIKTYRL